MAISRHCLTTKYLQRAEHDATAATLTPTIPVLTLLTQHAPRRGGALMVKRSDALDKLL
jgi:hypothetical protein